METHDERAKETGQCAQGPLSPGEAETARAEGIRRFILEGEKTFYVFGAVCKGMVRCGRPNCRCAKGQKHGPYYYLYWRVDGKAKRLYLGKDGAEIARRTLLEIRRKHWSGYDHYWRYRHGIKRGLVFLGAFVRSLRHPSSSKMIRFAELWAEMREIDAAKAQSDSGKKPQENTPGL